MTIITTHHFWRSTSDGEGWSNPHHTMETAEELARMNSTRRVCTRTLRFESLPTEALIAGVEPRIIDEDITEHTLGGHHAAA